MMTRDSQLCRVFAVLLVAGLICCSGCNEQQKKSAQIKTGHENDAAEQEFEKGENRPPTEKTLYATAELLAARGKVVEARQMLLNILDKDPKFVLAYNSLAEIYLQQGKAKAAIEILNKGLSVSPEDPVLLNNLGMCWVMRQQYAEALDKFTRAAGIRPENARYRANMAVALALLGRDKEALALFRQILPEDEAQHNMQILKQGRALAQPPGAGNG